MFNVIFTLLGPLFGQVMATCLSAKAIQVTPKYAQGFEIYKSKSWVMLHSKGVGEGKALQSEQYILIGQAPKEFCSKAIRFQNPLNRVVSLSSTHYGPMDELGILNTLVGHSYPTAKKLKSNFNIELIGHPFSVEKVLKLKPQAALGYVFESSEYESVKKLENLKIPFIYINEYNEENPLARSEWIKFFAVLFGKEEEGEKLFNQIESHYIAFKKLAQQSKIKPKILVGSSDQGAWIIPGGKSDLATLIADAKGEYLFNHLHQKTSPSISWEEILKKAKLTDVWLTHNYWTNLNQIKKSDSRYKLINAYLKKNVWNYNKAQSSDEGWSFWEKAGVRPDLFLRDLVKIIHPEIKDESLMGDFTWYKKL